MRWITALALLLFMALTTAVPAQTSMHVEKWTCADVPVASLDEVIGELIAERCEEAEDPSLAVRAVSCNDVLSVVLGTPESLVAASEGMRAICNAKRTPAPIVEWTCKAGAHFSVQTFEGLSVWVKAGGEDYLLFSVSRQPGRYERRGVSYMTGDGTAVLTGASGGPYEDCRAE